MTFQYFFFDTYIGYFLQALPIVLAVSAIYGFVRFRKDKETSISRKLFQFIFACYIIGLVCLVVGLDLMGMCWYNLLYSIDSGMTINWFAGEVDLIPDFFNNISGEVIGNFLMFLPFGVLYPLSQKSPSWKKTCIAGFVAVAAIEALQPVFGRAFDVNDIILNSLGIIVSASLYGAFQKVMRRK